MFNRFSLSTSWAGNKFESGKALVEKYKAMGFSKGELNYSISEKMYEELLVLVQAGEFEVTSVHHPFPKTWTEEYGTDSVMLGFLDDRKREKAVEMTKHSLDCAARLNAKVLVIHLSEVPFEVEHYDNRLKQLYREGKRGSKEYRKCFDKLIEHREASYLHVQKVVESLKELSAYIKEQGYELAIGIENRAMSHQIPDFYEAEYILSQLRDEPVYFWYDIGHGVMMENLGMFNNKAGLEKIIDKTIGVHIHDVEGMSDHRAPYELNDTLDAFLDLFKRIPFQILEIGRTVDEEVLVQGTKKLQEKMYG